MMAGVEGSRLARIGRIYDPEALRPPPPGPAEAMTATPSRTRQKLKPGAVVRCRTRRYLVEDVQAPLDPGADTVVALACMEDDAIGSRLTVFREREIDFEVLGESSWGAVAQRGFDQPRQFSAYLNTLRWNCVTATDAELFQAPYRAGIDVKAYQLEPLRKALLMPRVGLFIADDVGLGKTIEAGLILREMLLRQRIRRVVISCPPSVLRQWQEEMISRFGEEFPERIVEPLAIPRGSLPPDTPELKLSRLLQNYRKQREERLIREGAGKRELNAERLVITNLQKRLLSSIEAFARTLKVHQRSLAEKQEQRRGALANRGAQLDLLLGGADRDSDFSELSEEDLLNLEEAQTRAALRQTVQADQGELELLKQMGEIAEANRHRPDPRIIRLEAFLRTNLCANLGAAGARWQPTRLLIFTDYVDTKRYLERQLRILLAEDDPDCRIACFTGGMSEDNRERLKAQFNADPDEEPLRILLAKSHAWLGFDDDPFREALNCSLDLLGVSGLKQGRDGKGQPCWRLDNAEALVSSSNDRSWEHTLDSLRGVWDRRTPLWQWRQENPVRPVIFSDPGRLNAEAVHLHLEHRLVQRLLSRACVLASRDPQPRVLVLGRLSLFGQGATRLHDELISVIADWHPGADRTTALQPLIDGEREQAWNVLRQALAAGTTEGISETRRDQLQAQAAADVAALKPALDQAAEQAQAVAAALLKQRGDAEAAALKEVLRAQRSRINATVKQRNRDLAKLDRQAAAAEPTALIPGLEEQLEVPALDLQKLTTQERKQLAADQKHWQRRLETIEAELSSEPKRIQESYRVITHRLEPAGLVYLWPISG